MYNTVGADDAVSILSEMVSQHNIQERCNTDEETWPPDQPKNFTPLHGVNPPSRPVQHETTNNSGSGDPNR